MSNNTFSLTSSCKLHACSGFIVVGLSSFGWMNFQKFFFHTIVMLRSQWDNTIRLFIVLCDWNLFYKRIRSSCRLSGLHLRELMQGQQPFKKINLPFYNHFLIVPCCLDCLMCTDCLVIKLLWVLWRSEEIISLYKWEITNYWPICVMDKSITIILQNEQNWITLLQCYSLSFLLIQTWDPLPTFIFLA